MYYKILDNGKMTLVNSKKEPNDLLIFERLNSGLYNIGTAKDRIYADNTFTFNCKKTNMVDLDILILMKKWKQGNLI